MERLLDFVRRAVAELGVEVLLVPPLHVLERRELDLLNRAPRAAAADQLGLVETVHGLAMALSNESPTGPGRGRRARLAIRSV